MSGPILKLEHFVPTEDGGLQIWMFRSKNLERLAKEAGHLCSNDPTLPTGEDVISVRRRCEARRFLGLLHSF